MENQSYPPRHESPCGNPITGAPAGTYKTNRSLPPPSRSNTSKDRRHNRTLFLLCLILFCVVSTYEARPSMYIGAGPNFLLPQNRMAELNKEAPGFNILMESRTYCRVWWGLRIDYFSFTRLDTLTEGTDYFENAFNISPQVRYNIFGGDCYNDKVIPYLQGMFTVSSIGSTDGRSRFGLGAAGGGGVTMGFDFLSLCWLLDLNALWSAPNSITRADKRPSIQTINLSLTLSVAL